MADHTTGLGSFTVGETVSAYLNGNEGVAAAATATASATGTAAFTGLQPNKVYTLVGGTSGNRVRIHTGEDGLGPAGNRPGAMREVAITYDAASIAAATGVQVDIPAPAGTVDPGDTVIFIGKSGAEALTVSTRLITVADTIAVTIINSTAAPIDSIARSYRFLILKKRTNF